VGGLVVGILSAGVTLYVATHDRRAGEATARADRESSERRWQADRERQEQHWSQESARQQRERFLEHKQVRYAEFLRLTAEHSRVLLLHVAAIHAAWERWKADPSVEPSIDDLPPLSPTDPIARIGEEIMLLAPSQVHEAARALVDAIVELDRWSYDAAKPFPWYHAAGVKDDLTEADGRYFAAWATFVDAAKADLGTADGERRDAR
jgi:hypothetical protein